MTLHHLAWCDCWHLTGGGGHGLCSEVFVTYLPILFHIAMDVLLKIATFQPMQGIKQGKTPDKS
jgi:hypothetical protein